MAQVVGLGHVGIYVRDLEKMVWFYRDFLGMQVTKQNWDLGVVFLSSDPERSDHEIALVRGRPSDDDPRLIHQISLRVDTLDDLREFHRRVIAEGFEIRMLVNHASAIGCYFADPDGNTTEVFWVTGRPSWVPVSEPIDLDESDEALMAKVDTLWNRLREVPVGGVAPSPTT